MKISVNNKKLNLSWGKVLYSFIILFFVFYIVRDLDYNTAFVDEAIYATVGEEVLRQSYWEDATTWMGGSYIYPIVSANINRGYGLTGIRFFSLLSVLITGIAVGKISKRLGGRSAEIISLFLFFFSFVTLDLASLGTYDAPSLAFTSLALYAAVTSRKLKGLKEISYILLSGFFIATAILIKYIAVLFLPVLGLFILFKRNKLEIQHAIIWSLVVFAVLSIYLSFYLNDVVTFLTGSYSQEPSTFMKTSQEILKDFGLILVCAVFGLLSSLRISGTSKKDKEVKLLVRFLFLGGMATITYHLLASNIRSLWKHIVFASLFMVPPASWWLTNLYNRLRSNQEKTSFLLNATHFFSTLFALALITNLWINLSRHWRFQRSWPSASRAIAYLSENHKETDKVFAEASAIYKYHLFSGFTDPYSWSSTWYLEYKDKKDVEAMKLAIGDKYFAFVVLNNYFTPDINKQLMPNLLENYNLVMTDSYKVSGEYDNLTTLWARK